MGILDGDDPLAGIGRIPGLDDDGRAGRPSRALYRRPLPPEQFQSVGRQALDAGKSGLQYVLGTLDKPGQAVRGVLAGHGAAALKHLVPFSDSMGLTTEADHVSGRDLTDQYGLTRKGDNGWGAWGAGLAADIATDPLTYTTFGARHALTAGGEAAAKAGALKGLSRQAMIQGGHSGLVRVGVPFGPKAVFGTGAGAQRVAGTLDTAGDWMKYGNPVGRGYNALFDPAVHGAVDEITQRGAARYLDPALQGLRRQARTDQYGVIKGLDPLVSAAAHPEATITDAARAVAEGTPHPFGPNLANEVQPVASQIKGTNARRLAEARQAGAPINDVGDDYAGYVHRSALPENPNNLQVGGRKSGFLPVTSGANIARDALFRDIPGGTHRINDWFGRLAGNTDQALVARAVKKDLVADLVAGGKPMSRALGQQFDDKAAAMAERLAASSPERLATPTSRGGLFSPDLAADELQRGGQHARTVSSAKAAIGILGDIARANTPGSGLVPLSQAMKQIGLRTYKADQAAGTPMEGALVQMFQALGKQGAGPVAPFLHGKMRPLRGAVDQFGITPEHLGQLTRAYGKWAAPEAIKAPIKALDSFTNAFKALAYPIWIPAHVRNAMTAGVNNATRGVGIQDYLKQLRVMTGRGIDPAQADAIRHAQFASGNIFGGHGMNEEIAGNVQQAIQSGKRFTPRVPGSDRAGPTGNLLGDTANLVLNEGALGTLAAGGRAVRDSLGGLLGGGRHWGQSLGEQLGIKGVGGAAADALPAVKAGRKVGTNVEDFFRGAQWNKEVRSGATPEAAADAVNRLHFDYDRLTDFEKKAMRRAVPFYTFARKNLPLQVDTALHTPGIINAQYRPFYQEGPDEKGYVPRYLASGVAVPMGDEYQNADGGHSRQYLSKLGLPAEEAFERLHFAGGLPDLRATALDYAGQLNPVVKAPLEQLFNTQFHTQRRLSDLKAPATAGALGRLWGDDNPQLLSQVLANSPASRFVSSADKLMDGRKSLGQKLLNLGTGLRVTDVDVDKQRAIDTRAALESIMASHPNLSRYSSFYVKPEDAAGLTPDEVDLMRAYTQIQANAKAYAQQKRERIGVR